MPVTRNPAHANSSASGQTDGTEPDDATAGVAAVDDVIRWFMLSWSPSLDTRREVVHTASVSRVPRDSITVVADSRTTAGRDPHVRALAFQRAHGDGAGSEH